MADQKIRS